MLTFRSPFISSSAVYNSNTDFTISDNTTAERIIAIVPIPAGIIGANGTIAGHVYFSHTSNGNAKTYKIYLGNGTGVLGGALTANTSTAFITAGASTTTTSIGFDFFIGNRASQAVNVGGILGTRSTGANIAVVTGTIDTSTAQNLIVTATKAVGTDSVTLETLNLRLFK